MSSIFLSLHLLPSNFLPPGLTLVYLLWFTYSVFPVCTSAYVSLSYLRSSVCLLRHTGACLFSRRFRERRDAVFRDAAIKEPVPRLHIAGVYTRNSGRVTDVTKLNRLAEIIIAMNKQNLYSS